MIKMYFGNNNIIIRYLISASSMETIEHMLWECEKTQNLLVYFETLVDNKHIPFSYNKNCFFTWIYIKKNKHSKQSKTDMA